MRINMQDINFLIIWVKVKKKLCEIHNLSFLTGIAGIGLALLSAIYPITPSWDECLLLS